MRRGRRREARGKKKNMKKRMTLWLLATLFLANVSLADAQQPGKVPRIGFLDASTASGMAFGPARFARWPLAAQPFVGRTSEEQKMTGERNHMDIREPSDRLVLKEAPP